MEIDNERYEGYRRAREEYLSGRKTDGTEAKILRLGSNDYTVLDWTEINRSKEVLTAVQQEMRRLNDKWYALLTTKERTTPQDGERNMRKLRWERRHLRAAVRQCEREYRMAWELPFLAKRLVRATSEMMLGDSVHAGGTVTGRWRSDQPNLARNPVRTEAAKEVARSFDLNPGRRLFETVDYAEIEKRMLAQPGADEWVDYALRKR